MLDRQIDDCFFLLIDPNEEMVNQVSKRELQVAILSWSTPEAHSKVGMMHRHVLRSSIPHPQEQREIEISLKVPVVEYHSLYPNIGKYSTYSLLYKVLI